MRGFFLSTVWLLLAARIQASAIPIAGDGLLSARGFGLRSRQLAATVAPTCPAPLTPWVFAHFKVQNAADYSIDMWAEDIKLAHAVGFDGFALVIGQEAWIPIQVYNAYTAAKDTGLNFKLYLSFDMTDLVDTSQVIPFITQYGLHPNQFVYSSRVFASTLGGEKTVFDGGLSPALGWSQLFKTAVLKAGYPSYFVPSFPTVDPSNVFTEFPSADGIMSLDAWSTNGLDMSNATDVEYQALAAARSKTFMMTISPNYFIHNSNRPGTNVFQLGNAVRRTDDWAFVERWEQAIALQPDFVEVLSWNSYVESTYIGPLKNAVDQPSYAAGFPHDAWLTLSQYYIQRYKRGIYPQITTDTLVYWYRTHSKDAVASKDPLGKPIGWENVEDAIYMIALIASPQASLLTTSGIFKTNSTLLQGINKIKIQFVEGPVSLQLQQNGVTVASSSANPPIDNTIDEYNFNVWTGSLSAGST